MEHSIAPSTHIVMTEWLGNILAPPTQVNDSADVLLDRVQDSARIEDRRKAVKDLKELSRVDPKVRKPSYNKGVRSGVNVICGLFLTDGRY